MTKLSVVTYNILADAYIKRDRYPNSPPEALEPVARRGRLLDELESLSADVYCLQEVELAAFEAIRARLGSDYAGHFEPKPDAPDGLALLWRTTVLRCARHEVLRNPELGKGNALTSLIGLFEHDTGRLAIANMHLRWRPDDTPDSDHTGLLQLGQVLAHCDAVRAQWPAWILAGDFNANSQSRVVAKAEAHGYMISCRDQRPWDTTNINGRRRKIDYLLHTPEHLTPEPGRLPKLERRTPMPSLRFASDHLPLEVRFAST